MDVSIIIPANRDRGFLDLAIQSAMAQDFDDYEIILASDGNPELKKYADRYGIRYSQADKKNLSHNQNTAMKIAKGEFIKGLAEDDLLELNCLSDLRSSIGTYALVYARAINFSKNGETTHIPPKTIDAKELWIRKSSFIHGGTTMFRKDLFWEIGGRDESINSSEDYDFYLNLLTHGYEFIYCDSIVYRYRIHGGQKSNQNIAYRKQVKEYLHEKYRKYFEP